MVCSRATAGVTRRRERQVEKIASAEVGRGWYIQGAAAAGSPARRARGSAWAGVGAGQGRVACKDGRSLTRVYQAAMRGQSLRQAQVGMRKSR